MLSTDPVARTWTLLASSVVGVTPDFGYNPTTLFGRSGMTEPIIVCSGCKTEIKLTQSLTALLIDATRRQYAQKIPQKETDTGHC
jgi:hypothetical protein